MNEFTCYVGNQIKSYRKAARLTLQQLGDAIHKSRATVCKYESGEISPDLETLYEISQILQVSPAQLDCGFARIYSILLSLAYLLPLKRQTFPSNAEKPVFPGEAALFLFL